MQIQNGLITEIPFCHSPNYNERPGSNDISLLVIHDTEIVSSDNMAYDKTIVHYMFTRQYERFKQEYPIEYQNIFPGNQTRDVSAHLVIRRNGQIIQYVNFDKRAWHAGVSVFDEKEDCNDYSIGIELEGFADRADFVYTDNQYQQLAVITKLLLQSYPKITQDRITGHENIALPAGRKRDPGNTFDWQRYFELVKN